MNASSILRANEQWDELIYQMVRHYRERGSGIQYWEIANGPDIGEDGGCPYLSLRKITLAITSTR